jgi:hypothetical protein
MMLRTRSGTMQFRVVDKATGAGELVSLKEWLTVKQIRKVKSYPDFAWQFAQRLKKHYAAQGKDVAVYALGNVRLNRRDAAPFIDPKTDLAAEPWDHFRHHSWILPSPYQE